MIHTRIIYVATMYRAFSLQVAEVPQMRKSSVALVDPVLFLAAGLPGDGPAPGLPAPAARGGRVQPRHGAELRGAASGSDGGGAGGPGAGNTGGDMAQGGGAARFTLQMHFFSPLPDLNHFG